MPRTSRPSEEPPLASRTRKSPRRFGSYAATEAGNILLLPGVAFYFGRPASSAEIFALLVASAASAIFLLVGALYWLGLHRRLSGEGSKPLGTALAFADRAETPGKFLTAVAAMSVVVILAQRGWSPALVAASLLSLLAALEYVNYYHRQLQHFDNWAKFKRLITGTGLKPSHMARDLAGYRRG